jgi:NAD-specific glutamate dehydrogenase
MAKIGQHTILFWKKKKQKKKINRKNIHWTVRKGIAPRNKKGQFTTRKGLMFAIANSVYHTGLETTNFFTKPFENEFNKLPNELVEAYGLEVEKFLKFTLN